MDQYGDIYRYCKAAAGAITKGKLVQQAAGPADHIKDLAVASAAAIGDKSITITNGPTTAITVDMFKDGIVFVNDADGEGQCLRIVSNTAAATGDSCVLTLQDALTTALTTSSQVGLRKNLCKDVIVNPTTPSGKPLGITTLDITASYYFWALVKGSAAVLTHGTVIVGKMVAPGATTAGSVDTYPITLTEGTPNTYVPGDSPCVGIVLSVGASTEYSLIAVDLL